jgi:hypothetical protein
MENKPVRKTKIRTRLLLTLAVMIVCALSWAGVTPDSALASVNTYVPPSFAPAQSYATGQYALQVVVADFNRDGNLDVAVANLSGYTVSVRLGNGSGGFGALTNFYLNNPVFSIAAGDFNRDGKPDLVATVSGANNTGLALLVGDGAGGFDAPNFFDSTFGLSVIANDFNADGKADLAVACRNVNTNEYGVKILLGDGAGGFGAPAFYAAPGGVYAIAVHDFDANGTPDLAVGDGYVSILLGRGDGSFVLTGESPYQVGGAHSIAVGYFDDGGESDLIVGNYGTGHVTAMLGGPGGLFTVGLTFGAHDSPTGVAVSDFNGDGRDDVAVSNSDSFDVSVLSGGAGNTYLFAPKVDFPVGSGRPQSIATGDFNNDGRPDIVTANDAGYFAVLLNNLNALTISGRVTDGGGSPLLFFRQPDGGRKLHCHSEPDPALLQPFEPGHQQSARLSDGEF